MDFPDEKLCLNHIMINFQRLVDEYQCEIEFSAYKKFNVKVIYVNAKTKRKIEIGNETNYTDYGFYIFVRSTDDNSYSTPINIPFLKQDRECRFIEKAANKFFERYLDYCAK